MSDAVNPILVEVTRGPIVESRHRGACCVYDATGARVAAWGDVDRPVYPRSAVKILQAVPFLETGAADRVQAAGPEIAIACASHAGEPAHIEVVRGWMERLGLSEAHFACGAHAPGGEAAAVAMHRAGGTPSRLHSNCSGKHLGMLSTAIACNEALEGYHEPDHPVQRRVRAALEELTGETLLAAPMGIDGCSLPTYGIALTGLARGMARVADPRGLKVMRQSALRRLRLAVAMHPLMVGGADRFDTALARRKGQGVYAKVGAEGVYAAAIPEMGLGIALKIDDGAKRAAEVALAAVLRYLEALDDEDWESLRSFVAPDLRNYAGQDVGAIRVAPGWPHGRGA